ncbi:hypothetical protein ACIP8Z_09025 [Streptomyces sp. NPDC088553]|uniref:hypothetical protein n=1 Tax=Streptomyces sp. NPDC088553 TaxID=3365864 RepID=UPI00380B5E42
MTLFLAVLVVAMVLGLIGATAEGLFYLLIIGIVLLAADVVHFGLRLRHSSRRPFAEVRVGGSAVALVAPALPRIPGVIMTSVSRVGPALGW